MNLADVIIEETQIKRGVNNYLHQIFDELKTAALEENEQNLELVNEEGITKFKTRIEFFEFIRDCANEGIKMINQEETAN